MAAHPGAAATMMMPAIGLGTWQISRQDILPALKAALTVGYRHIDCAADYENEDAIGDALQNLLLPSPSTVSSTAAIQPSPTINQISQLNITRSDLFITSKLWNTFHLPSAVASACNRTLNDLKLDYLDLYLMHFPLAFKDRGDGNYYKDESGRPMMEDVTISETWNAMEELVYSNKVRAIGVSNFSISKLKELLSNCRIKPAVNQVEMHPYLPQHDLLEFCKQHDIVVTAYSPLGSSPQENTPILLKDPVILGIARRNQITPAQVLLRWGVQRGTVVIPKSSNVERIRENFLAAAGGLKLADEDFKTISELTKNGTTKRYCDPMEWWGLDIFDP
ncbi:hypothetical protein HDU76_000660 [Blyttiomyces sp. JEL0837]|nr:hypothetical protein HDU76_000660 [Blyttiomyces sp. JEL0837]